MRADACKQLTKCVTDNGATLGEAGDERTELFLDECGGHASPYHFHADLVCEYDLTTGTHSRATGAALDGRIIYGAYCVTDCPLSSAAIA